MRDFFRITVAVVTLAFVAYPMLTEAPVGPRREPILDIWPEASVVFGGDMMFDRTVRLAMERYGEDYVFSCIAETLREADLVVANLEGPITEYPSMSLRSEIASPENYTFTFPTSTASLLARHNIQLVNLGNNHIQNFGWDGVSSTLKYLRAGGVGHFGDPLEQKVAYEEIGGVKLAFIGYNEFSPAGWKDSASTTLAHVREARSRGYVPVVYAHWGDEYALLPPERVREQARVFVEAGASVVIGSHPHVVQEEEMYRGKPIFYSLGNFVFDQYWNEEVRRGLLLKVEFNENGVSRLERIPIYNQSDQRPCAV